MEVEVRDDHDKTADAGGREMEAMGNQRAAIKHYMRRHREERCPVCSRFVGNHSYKQFARCIHRSRPPG